MSVSKESECQIIRFADLAPIADAGTSSVHAHEKRFSFSYKIIIITERGRERKRRGSIIQLIRNASARQSRRTVVIKERDINRVKSNGGGCGINAARASYT